MLGHGFNRIFYDVSVCCVLCSLLHFADYPMCNLAYAFLKERDTFLYLLSEIVFFYFQRKINGIILQEAIFPPLGSKYISSERTTNDKTVHSDTNKS